MNLLDPVRIPVSIPSLAIEWMLEQWNSSLLTYCDSLQHAFDEDIIFRECLDDLVIVGEIDEDGDCILCDGL